MSSISNKLITSVSSVLYLSIVSSHNPGSTTSIYFFSLSKLKTLKLCSKNTLLLSLFTYLSISIKLSNSVSVISSSPKINSLASCFSNSLVSPLYAYV